MTNINKKIKFIAPLIFMTGGIIWINQDTVKADTAPQSDIVKNDEYIATSAEYGKIGGESGSDWSIDANGVLKIQSGTWDDNSVSGFWNNLQDSDGSVGDKIKSVIFEGDVKAGSSLERLFSSTPNLKSVSVASNAQFDTSKTTSFKGMFSDDGNLKDIDLGMFNWENVENSVNMFSNTGLESVSMENINAPKLKLTSAMFSNCQFLKTANFDGTEFNKDGVSLSNFISNCPNLETVSLKNAFTGKITAADSMFQSDYALENLDVSAMHLDNENSGDYNLMFDVSNNSATEVKRKSITLPANANITDTGIDTFNKIRYKCWSSDLSEFADSLVGYYNDNPNIGKTTWTLVENEKAKYKVNYVDENNDLIKSEEKTGFINAYAEVDPILGYVFSDDFNDDDLKIDNSDQVFTVHLIKLAPYVATVTVKYDDGHPDETFDIEVPFGMSDPASQMDQTILDKYFDNDSLELDKSYFYMNRYVDPTDAEGLPFSSLNTIGVSGDNLKDIFNNSIDFAQNNLPVDASKNISGQKLNLFEVHFDHYIEPENNNTNNTSTDKKITTIDQKVATFNKTTTLYDNDGKQISDVKLSQNSDWKNDQKMILDGVTYYRVSTNAWVKASDLYVYTDINSKIRVHQDKRSRIKKATGELTDRALEKSTEWKTDRYTTVNGDKYYRVSTNGFVNANEVDEYTD
ncbi:SLAP domain-containing protein [Companilactobacillus baiquanensis]|uniref:SLAP domain-containing protein n=1 Tax=Companilactobacillus baiquanensis TaxID=2486005 RepID=A0ABW1UYA6_9LACO